MGRSKTALTTVNSPLCMKAGQQKLSMRCFWQFSFHEGDCPSSEAKAPRLERFAPRNVAEKPQL
jgi:hypothetical protein